MSPRWPSSLPVTCRLTPEDTHWPKPLCDLADPPVSIELSGQLPIWSPAVAIVGTRHPEPRAAQLARALGRELAEAGWLVVSGGALGIDAEAHRGALEAGKPTVAVLGTPLSNLYPPENRPLLHEIAESGCVLSEVLADDPMYRARFIQRNRIIAALTSITVVVQAPFASGALSTAAAAKRLGRTVLAVPHGPWDALGEGCLGLLAEGAGICRDSRDVLLLSAAGPQKRLVRKRAKVLGRPEKAIEFQGLDEDERAVVEALSKGTLAADELCELTSLPAPRVQRAVLMLLLSKVIHEVGSGRYTRCDYR